METSPGLNEFTTCWRKQPDELKLVDRETFYLAKNFMMYEDSWEGPRRLTQADPLNLLYSTREIASLAKEVFFSRNVFKIQSLVTAKNPILYPPQAVSYLIRRLEITVRPRVRDWNFVRRLAHNGESFERLKIIQLTFDHYSYNSNYNLQACLHNKIDSNAMVFDVDELVVRFVCERYRISNGIQEINKTLFEQITIGLDDDCKPHKSMEEDDYSRPGDFWDIRRR